MLTIAMIKVARLFILPVLVTSGDQWETAPRFSALSLLGIVDSPECLDLLLQHGAKVNSQDLKINTPAMVACFFNKPRLLTTLIRANADLLVRNNEGKPYQTFLLHSLFVSRYVGKDALDVATEKEFDECKDIVSKALEKRDLKPTSKPNSQKQAEEPQKTNAKR